MVLDLCKSHKKYVVIYYYIVKLSEILFLSLRHSFTYTDNIMDNSFRSELLSLFNRQHFDILQLEKHM